MAWGLTSKGARGHSHSATCILNPGPCRIASATFREKGTSPFPAGHPSTVSVNRSALVITSLEGWLLTPPLMGKAERMSALTVFLGLLL